MSWLAADAATALVIWRRDLTLFFRQKSRIAGALLQPLLFWLVLGAGLAPTFQLDAGDLNYQTYFFPGVVLMIVLFASIFSTMSVIEDRREGFLQGVLVGPGSRAAIVLGKCLGSTSVALIQAILFVLLGPLAGFPLGSISWLPLVVFLGLGSMALAATGFVLAWWLDSTQGYHVVMSLILMPAWMVSGAVFPVAGAPPILAGVVRFNPLSYAVAGSRRALHGGVLPAGTELPGVGPGGELLVTIITAVVLFGLAILVAHRRRRPD